MNDSLCSVFLFYLCRMFGVTEEGHSVCCHVHGFPPYFYVSLPESFQPMHCGEFKAALNKALLGDLKSNREGISEAVLAVDIVYKLNIYGYHSDTKTPFAKILLAIPRCVLYSFNMWFLSYSYIF